MIAHAELRDGREMVVRNATTEDADAIAAEHPLPREGQAPEHLYRAYYKAKTLIYVRAPGAGVVTGWVDDQLAGFIFHCADIDAVGSYTKSPANLVWLTGQAVRGRFGYSPRFWLDMAKWGAQHFRKPQDYGAEEQDTKAPPDLAAWIGTVHTVPAFRRLGVASHLLDAAEDALRQTGARRVALWVACDNVPAQNLYIKRSYDQVSVLERIGEKCVLMTKELTVSTGTSNPSNTT